MTRTFIPRSRPEHCLQELQKIALDPQPDQTGFQQLDILLNTLGNEVQKGTVLKEEIFGIVRGFGTAFLEETLQGRGYLKPCGYPEDFLLLDRIYTWQTSGDPRYGSWDTYFQQHAAIRALRSRKRYFKDLVLSRVSRNRNLRILNVVSGSGRELLELYRELPYGHNVQTSCVEIDDQAIAFSRQLNVNYLKSLNYIHQNIRNYQSPEKYDFIWAGRLFDYLEDSAVIKLLHTFGSWLKPEGEIVAGNFNSAYNPSRNYQALLMDWEPEHRDEAQLRSLSLDAGFCQKQIRIEAGEENVILMLHLKTE